MVRFRVNVWGMVRSRARVTVKVRVMFRIRISGMVRTRAFVRVKVSD